MINEIIKIKDLNFDEISPYKTLRNTMEHFEKGILIAEGEKVVSRLFESNLKIISLLMTEEWLNKYKGIINSSKENVKIYVGDKILLETIVGHKLHQSIMALAKIPAEEENIFKKENNNLIVALDDIASAENVGVIVRNCAAFGVDAIIVGESSANPYLRRAVRNSMGNVFKIPIINSKNLIQSLSELENNNFEIIIAHTSENSRSIFEYNFKKNVCIVFGGEGYGPRKMVLDKFQNHLIIPMCNEVDSINVANSSSVLLYEVARQRNI